MKKKDKYIIAITILSLILTISLFVNILCFVIISDLNETVDIFYISFIFKIIFSVFIKLIL